MSTYVTGSMELHVPPRAPHAARAALAATSAGRYPSGAQIDLDGDPLEVLFIDLGFTGTEPLSDDDGTTHWWGEFDGNWDDRTIGWALGLLAAAGVTGSGEFTGEAGTRFKVVLRQGKVVELSEVSFYPGDDVPGSPVVALNATEVQTILAVIAGESPDELPAVVARLTAAL